MTKKYTLLLVDDEKNILRSLRRLLHREDYQILLAQNGKEGLELLANNKVDLVMSDMRMPEMNGAVFLKKVHALYPNTIRLILTGYAERETVQRAFSEAEAHEMISKPWDDDELKKILRESLSQIDEQENQNTGLHTIIDETDVLPSLPESYLTVQKALEQADDSSADSVAQVLVMDPPLAARILQIANSSFFGQRRKVETISRAIFILGLEMVRNLVLAISAIQNLRPNNVAAIDMESFWQHSLSCGAIARHISHKQGGKKDAQETAMLAGTLHDLGKLILAKYAETRYRTVLRATDERQALLVDIERELMETDHALVGGYLAEWWKLPSSIAYAVRFHAEPAKAGRDQYLPHLIHLADILAYRLDLGSSGPGRTPEIAPSVPSVLELSPAALNQLEKELREMNLAIN